MRSIITIFTLSLVIVLAGCGDEDENNDDNASTNVQTNNQTTNNSSSSTNSTTAAEACSVPRDSRSCDCPGDEPGGQTGAQFCGDDGFWESCLCESVTADDFTCCVAAAFYECETTAEADACTADADPGSCTANAARDSECM